MSNGKKNDKVFNIVNSEIDIKRAVKTGVAILISFTIGVIACALLFENDTDDNISNSSVQSISDDISNNDNSSNTYENNIYKDNPNGGSGNKQPDIEQNNNMAEKSRFRFGQRTAPNGGGNGGGGANPSSCTPSVNVNNDSSNHITDTTAITLSNHSIRINNSVSEQDDQQDITNEQQILQYNVHLNAPNIDPIPPMQVLGGQGGVFINKMQTCACTSYITTETKPESETETEPESETESETEAESESETEAETDAETKSNNKFVKTKQSKLRKLNKMQHNQKKLFKKHILS